MAFVLVGGLSCDLFETRKPNDPGLNTFPCATLDAAENVFVNIRQAYGRGDGLPCYFSSLAESMVFDFDDADSSFAGAQYVNYTKSIEQRIAQNIASDSDLDSFLLDLKLPYTPVLIQSDVQTRRYSYQIDFKGTVIPERLFQGLAEITVRKEAGGQWAVVSWVDRPDPAGTTSRTWGYLRGQYRIGF